MVNFRLKVAQIWDLSSENQGLEAFAGAKPRTSNPWISDDKSQIWATFRWKLTIVHKSKYFSFQKFIDAIFFFFIWPNSQFLTTWPLLTSIFSQVLKVTKNFFSWGDSVFLIDIENSIDLIAFFFLRDGRMSQVGVSSECVPYVVIGRKPALSWSKRINVWYLKKYLT